MIINLKEKINNFFSHPFVKDTAILQVGNVLSIGIGIIASILIARLLQPEKYGLYGLVFAFAGLLGLFTNWGAEKATVTLFSEAYGRGDKKEINDILTYFLKINIFIFLTVGLVTILIAPLLSQYFYRSLEIGQLARLVILMSMLGIFFGILTITLQVLRQMGYYVAVNILDSLFKGIFAVLLIFLGWSVLGIVIGHLLAAFILLIISIFFYESLNKENEYLPSLKDLFLNFWQVSVKKYFKFGFLIAIDGNLSHLYRYSPMVFLGMFVAVQEIGYLKIALNYISLPLILLGPVAQLLNIQLPMTKALSPQSLKNNFIKVTVYSFFIAAGLMVVLILLAPFLVRFFYGISFLPSVKFIHYLAGFAVFSSIGIGVGAMFRTLDKMNIALKINILVIIFGLPLVFWLIKTYGALGAGFANFGWLLISDIIGVLYILKFLNKK